jgi:hypothetical protein
VGIFPANREKNREFRENRPSQSILKRLLSAVSMTCRQIPYEIEQGIFSAKQGIVSTEQGSGANEVSVHFSHACFGRPERDLFSPAFLQARRIEMVDGWRSRMCCGEAFWRAHHEAWRQSDLNQREYCEDQGIPLKAFGNWRAKFKAEPQPPAPKLLYRRGGLSRIPSVAAALQGPRFP